MVLHSGSNPRQRLPTRPAVVKVGSALVGKPVPAGTLWWWPWTVRVPFAGRQRFLYKAATSDYDFFAFKRLFAAVSASTSASRPAEYSIYAFFSGIPAALAFGLLSRTLLCTSSYSNIDLGRTNQRSTLRARKTTHRLSDVPVAG